MEGDLNFDMEAIRQVFLAEASEGLAEMEAALIELEQRPGDAEALHLVFRQAHTIKGSAATIGLTDVADIAHAMEDLLEQLRNGSLAVTSARTTLLLRAVDALRATIPHAVEGIEGVTPEAERALADLADASVSTDTRRATASAVTADSKGLDPTASSERSETRRVRTLRVDAEKLDRLLDLTGEIAIARGRLRLAIDSLRGDGTESIAAALWEADALHQELQEQVMRARMVPLGPVFRQFARTVRDLSMDQGKLVQLKLEGEDVEVDMTVVDHLRDPLTHMLRNAIDHGLEHPGDRQARGKPPIGTITVRARHERGSVVIEIADDGAGLSRARILARAEAHGLVSDGDSLSDAEVFRLICLPGLSTADTVTDLSGRGVGMDVVRRNVEALRGTLAIASTEGSGTTITIRLPLTLAIIQGFAIGVGDETFLVPLDSVTECLRLPRELTGSDDATGLLNLRGEVLPYVRLGQQFGLGHAPDARQESVLVVHDQHGRAGLVVDALHGETQAVIKPLGRMLTGLPGISGSTILGNGRVALILDVSSILEDARTLSSSMTPA